MKSCKSFIAIFWAAAIVGVLAASGCDSAGQPLDKNAPVPQPPRPADSKGMPPEYGVVLPPGKTAPETAKKK